MIARQRVQAQSSSK